MFKAWSELTPYEKNYAREQYLYMRACEEETTLEEAIANHTTADDFMECMKYDIDRDGALTVIIQS